MQMLGPHRPVECCDCHNPNSIIVSGREGLQALELKAPWNTHIGTQTMMCANWRNNLQSGPDQKGDHRDIACYCCHIVVPRGGMMWRLIADRDGAMPGRYAYQGNLSNVQVQASRKQANYTNYGKQDCQAACTNDHDQSPGAQYNWN